MENVLSVIESASAIVNIESVEFINAALLAVRKYLIQNGYQNEWYFDDVVQESSEKIWRYRYSFDTAKGIKAIGPWASVIALHCLEDFRKQLDPNYTTLKEAVHARYTNTIYDMEYPEFATNPEYHKLKQPIAFCMIDQTILDEVGDIVGYCYENEHPIWDTPESLYVDNEKFEAVMDMMERLNPRRSAALKMSIDGYSNSEIAQAMVCSEQAVYNLLSNGRKLLAKMIKETGILAA